MKHHVIKAPPDAIIPFHRWPTSIIPLHNDTHGDKLANKLSLPEPRGEVPTT
jgi:hypothetical protein